MTAVLKAKTYTESPHVARMFRRLGALFTAAQAPTKSCVLAELEKSRIEFNRGVRVDELQALRDTVKSLALFIEDLGQDGSSSQPDLSVAELVKAKLEDEAGTLALRRKHVPSSDEMTTQKSVQTGDALIAQCLHASKESMARRIAKGEFLASGELQRLLHIKRASISAAVKAGRMFAVVGPSGNNYYPAYFADERLDRRALEKVARVLGQLPGASKHYFFTAKSIALNSTPLDALRDGRLEEVLTVATSFTER
ncbi:hypothetical protein LXA47_28800 [Massilia sp. P8910]|uniref:hypothetical protein n=1 Tax=Massilia antarctica TaxID=2765360 RepID=UPI001E337EA1|nr:hypothetical protein [Massilia antarctica]MCE3607573.1 hypothetical protein [Massilia antarctica]